MKNTMNMLNEVEVSIQEIAKANRTAIETAVELKILIEKLEEQNAKISKALQDAADKLLKIQTESAEKATAKKPSKLWSIVYPKEAGVWKTYYLAKDINIALGGSGLERDVREMLDGIHRGEYKELRRNEVRYIGGLKEYRGSLVSYWMDEDAVDGATEWVASKERRRGNRRRVQKDYDIEALAKTYKETQSAYKTAKIFGMSPTCVIRALRNEGIEIRKQGARPKKVTPEMESEIIRLFVNDGLSQTMIAKITGLSQSTISEILRRNGIKKFI